MIISMSFNTIMEEHESTYNREADYNCGHCETFTTTLKIKTTSLDESEKLINGVIKELGDKFKIGRKGYSKK